MMLTVIYVTLFIIFIYTNNFESINLIIYLLILN